MSRKKTAGKAESCTPLSLYQEEHGMAAGYPRPQMVRKEWISLDGTWQFAFDDEDRGEREAWYRKTEEELLQPGIDRSMQIQVPYSYETLRSGIGKEEAHPVVWYWKRMIIPKSRETALPERRFLLHFDSCDYETKVWINGQYQGSHIGGYTRFTFDAGRWKEGNVLDICVRAEDRLSEEQMRGKQRWLPQNYGCWYVQTTGIWKSVWMEPVGDVYVKSLKLTPDIHKKEVELEMRIRMPEPGVGAPGTEDDILTVQCTVSRQGCAVSRTEVSVRNGEIRAGLPVYDTRAGEWGAALWTPACPTLYDLDVVILSGGREADRFRSYFGMREVKSEGGYILLNGQPLYQKLILYQGYRADGGLTDCRDEEMTDDLEKILEMGFNGLRIHQKTESERFLYWCDVKGLLVWAEAPSFYRFSEEAAECFAREWMGIVEQHYNHPSVIVWTPLNESWGVPDIQNDGQQKHFAQMLWHMTKMADGMRPVIGNDGWEHTVTDIVTLHDYEEDGRQMAEKYRAKMDDILSGAFFHNNYRRAFADGFTYHGQPVILSEYGGAAFADKGEGDWGYGTSVCSEEEFLGRFRELTLGIKSIPEICGYCYTQFTDVQQEKNGLLTEERRYKVSPEKIREINEAPAGMFVNKKGY